MHIFYSGQEVVAGDRIVMVSVINYISPKNKLEVKVVNPGLLESVECKGKIGRLDPWIIH